MIKLTKPAEPQYLILNKHNLIQKLLAAVTKYGSYSDIPEKEKNKLISPYKHIEVKTPLFKSSLSKCAFCECLPTEGGNIEVEHFKPKSIYPEKTFDWENLLPSCRKCNNNKLDHDTGLEPLINPYINDPEVLYTYNDIEMIAIKGPLYKEANKTIEICGLNTFRMYKPRADILISLRGYINSLKSAIDDYHEADTERKKNNRIRKMIDSIDTIKSLTNPDKKYSGFCKYFLSNNKTYENAKQIIKTVTT